MQPDLEIVEVQGDESFTAWAHGYPYRTVRWHFHPEYEIQLIVETQGVYFVGDHVGHFEPGNLVFMGPDLPHNWISDVPTGQSVERRGIVIQFPAALVRNMAATFPEFRRIEPLLAESASGLLFSAATAAAAKPIMEALLEARGLRRVVLLLSLFELLVASDDRQRLASPAFTPDPKAFMSHAINNVLAHIAANLGDELREPMLAELVGQSPSAFSRSFRKHTGQSFVRYVNRLRIGRACELLANSDKPVLDVCMDVGFNNVSNFNRQFLLHKRMPPTKFRHFHRMQLAASRAANSPP
ncbi:helix-turn-helix domain-containing protein [Variovorax boronicumulans]|uniref:helix-turn-helix domain-containing protein n=1 Tax=Variovorax boronicumulans TaxID=436515 RepID=UPI00085C56B4|nr:AraC family transcriptional regulator [Variovorax boronicumulans]OEZ28686.1 AraC family transcriptional regulator [Variovorax boronicumulans]